MKIAVPCWRFEQPGLLHQPERWQSTSERFQYRPHKTSADNGGCFVRYGSPGPPHLRMRPAPVGFVYQVEAHVGRSGLRSLLPGAVFGQLDGAPRDILFESRCAGQELDRVPMRSRVEKSILA